MTSQPQWMMDAQRLVQAIDGCPGMAIAARQRELAWSYRLIEGNLADLNRAVADARVPTDQWCEPSRWPIARGYLTRLLFNALMAAKAFLEHARSHADALPGNPMTPEITNRLNAVWKNDPRSFFTNALRNVAAHRALPFVEAPVTLSASPGESPKIIIDLEIQLDQMLALDSFQSRPEMVVAATWAKANLPAVVSVEALVQPCAEFVAEEWDWLRTREREIHAADVGEYDRLMAEFTALAASVDIPLEQFYALRGPEAVPESWLR